MVDLVDIIPEKDNEMVSVVDLVGSYFSYWKYTCS